MEKLKELQQYLMGVEPYKLCIAIVIILTVIIIIGLIVENTTGKGDKVSCTVGTVPRSVHCKSNHKKYLKKQNILSRWSEQAKRRRRIRRWKNEEKADNKIVAFFKEYKEKRETQRWLKEDINNE